MRRKGTTTVFLKECMADALLKLMENEPLGKITVQQITNLAGVGRATWFRNFASKSDALTFWLVRRWECWAEDHGMKERRRFTVENGSEFFQFNHSIRSTLELIDRAGMQSALYTAFCTVMAPQFGADPEECYHSRFYANGLYGLLGEWVKRGFYESPEEMTALFLAVVADSTTKHQ